MSVLSLLRERAGLPPDDTAFSSADYEQDWALNVVHAECVRQPDTHVVSTTIEIDALDLDSDAA